MGGFKFEQCGNIEGLYLVEPQVFSDERGYNLEAYHAGLSLIHIFSGE